MAEWVHVCAENYRQIVNALSYPGEIYSLNLKEVDNPFYGKIDSSVLIMVMMLLDNEVTYHVVGNESKETSEIIRKMTFAKEVDVSIADFIVILNPKDVDHLEEIFKTAKKGDLVDPQNSAMIVLNNSEMEMGKTFNIEGPGIKDHKKIHLGNIGKVMAYRNKRVDEFPMGVDLLLINNDQLMALPRTTIIKEEEDGICCS